MTQLMKSTDTWKRAVAASAVLCVALFSDLAVAQSAPTPVTPIEKKATAVVPAATEKPLTDKPLFGRYSEIGALRLGASLGPDFFSSTAGFRAQADLQYSLLEVAPQLSLDLAGHLGGVFASPGMIFELVPKARIRYTALTPLILYGDGGVGLALSSFSGGGNSNTQVWGTLRFAGGVQYKLTPEWNLVVEPVGLNIYFGTGSAFHYSVLAGFLYRM